MGIVYEAICITTRSISLGLAYANELLQNVEEDAIKNVVLFTTGMTNAGDYSYDGQYDENTVGSIWRRTDTQVKLYAYANSAYEQAELLKEKDIWLYTIGLFQTMEKMPDEGRDIVSFFKLTANDLASSDEYYYYVDDPDNLEFTFGEVADNIVNQSKEITFTYESGNDYTAKCYYSNDYFADSAYNYNPSLATMSLSFALSAFGSSEGDKFDYSDKSANARRLLMDIGVPEENIQTNEWFTKKPETDSIGVIIGNKAINVKGKNYTLIALAIRGGGYEAEWASNFTIGISGQHDGFNTAKNNVLDFLKTYIDEQGIIGSVKIWITGYSRAAATANLLAGAIDDGETISTDISYSCDDIYAYCFETPAGALVDDVKRKTRYNYTEDANVQFHNGGYRIVRINCMVDISVYDNTGNKVACIENERPDMTLDTSYIYGIDEDGQKYIVLPIDSDFEISIIAREDDEVNYSISEYSALKGNYTRNINYFKIDMRQGEMLVGTLPSYSDEEIANDIPNGSNVVYILKDSSENIIESNSDKRGMDVANDVYNINAVSNNTSYGVVFGSGVCLFGTFAQVEAIALADYEFVGWYIDENLVSTETTYRICVTDNIDLVGKFKDLSDVSDVAEDETVHEIVHDNIHNNIQNTEHISGIIYKRTVESHVIEEDVSKENEYNVTETTSVDNITTIEIEKTDSNTISENINGRDSSLISSTEDVEHDSGVDSYEEEVSENDVIADTVVKDIEDTLSEDYGNESDVVNEGDVVTDSVVTDDYSKGILWIVPVIISVISLAVGIVIKRMYGVL